MESGSTKQPVLLGKRRTAFKVVSFVIISLLILYLGSFAAEYLSWRNNGRYYLPNVGSYYGGANGRFIHLGEDFSFIFRFRGYSSTNWYWLRPTNFAYTNLTLEWSAASISDAQSIEGKGVLLLPSFEYRTSVATNILTEKILQDMLVRGDAKEDVRLGRESTAKLFGYLKAAGEGSLPPPRHHNYHFDAAGDQRWGDLTHFALGQGYSDYSLAWWGVWLVGVVLAGFSVFKRRSP